MLPNQGLPTESQTPLDQNLDYEQPVEHMTEQELEAALSRVRWELALAVSSATLSACIHCEEQDCLDGNCRSMT